MDKKELEDWVTIGEPKKWDINPEACIREIPRMESEPGYLETICGIHRKLWVILNVDLKDCIPIDRLEELNGLLSKAFLMGKRMDFRLQKYVLERSLAEVVSALLHKEIHFKGPKNPSAIKAKGKKK